MGALSNTPRDPRYAKMNALLASPKETTREALNLSARETSPMKVSELKDNRMNPSGISAPQVHAED